MTPMSGKAKAKINKLDYIKLKNKTLTHQQKLYKTQEQPDEW